MPNGAAFHIATARHLPIVAILALLMLPVDLRAGANQPHPHAIFQIIDDVADGALDHDHAALEQGYGVHHHDHDVVAPWRAGQSPDLPRVSAAGAGAESGLAATMSPLLLTLPVAERSQRLDSIRSMWLRSAPPRPPFPPPRQVA